MYSLRTGRIVDAGTSSSAGGPARASRGQAIGYRRVERRLALAPEKAGRAGKRMTKLCDVPGQAENGHDSYQLWHGLTYLQSLPPTRKQPHWRLLAHELRVHVLRKRDTLTIARGSPG